MKITFGIWIGIASPADGEIFLKTPIFSSM
jgi:hypothetical protein